MPGRHPLCRLPGAGLVANLELRKAINQQIREIWFALWSTLPDKQFHASPFRFVCTPEKAGQYANAWDVISMSWPVGFHDGLMYVVLLSFLSAFVFACQSWSFYMSSKLLTGYEEALRPLGFFWIVMWRTGFMGDCGAISIILDQLCYCVARAPPWNMSLHEPKVNHWGWGRKS